MKEPVRKTKAGIGIKLGIELDRRARLRMRRKPTLSYRESLRYEMKKDPKLATRYIRSSKPDLLRDLEKVANLLNKEKTPGLRDLLAPMISPRHFHGTEINKAALGLTRKLSELQPTWRYSVRTKRVVFWLRFPETIMGTIATALLASDPSLLKCCPWCSDFFVTTDHRVEYHAICYREQEADRLRRYRRKQRR